VDLLPWIAAERRGTADLIDSLTPQQLAQRSLCEAWTVHDVGAHLLMPLVTPIPKFAAVMAMSGFSFDRANLRLTTGVARRTSGQIALGLRERAETPFKPPGLGFEAPLNDLLVHQLDMRRPLGLAKTIDPDRLRISLDFAAGLRLERPKPESVLTGLRFQAHDVGWSWGSGPLVVGTGEALLLLLNRRSVDLVHLDGPGADLLRERIG
jgi:uncharacterized protein (TIGR03083 family)